MMNELAENYRRGYAISKENKRLREQASNWAAEKISSEESHAQQVAQLKESVDEHLSARRVAEEKLFAAEDEIRSLREQLSASQDSFAAHLEAERLSEEAREKAEREVQDLQNQLSTRDVIFNDMKAVLEVEAVDRYKRSPAYDAFLLREFERGMRQSKKFFAMKDHSTEKALRRFEKSLQLHMDDAVSSIKEQIKRWKAHCRYTGTDPHPMHLEIPSRRALHTYFSGRKGSFSGSGAEPDLGPVAGRDYEPFMPEGDEVVVWPSEDEIGDDDEDNVEDGGDDAPAKI
jgi:DNA-binding transcriptional regulator YiaG